MIIKQFFEWLLEGPGRFSWFASLAINLIVICNWLKGKIVLDRFLAGQWSGTLVSGSERLVCELMIIEHDKRENTAQLFYKRFDSADNLIARGLDSLTNYKGEPLFFLPQKRVWTASFVREFHKPDTTRANPPRYDWVYKIDSIFLSSKMQATVKVRSDLLFSGFLHKT